MSTYIRTGNTFRVFDSSVETFEALPVGTYRVQFSPMSGPHLDVIEDLVPPQGKTYGDHERRVQRIMRAYERFDRSMGVLLSGDKGMGKSMSVNTMASTALKDLGLPVIAVDKNFPGVAEFIDSLGEVMVIFDEFEKTFPVESEDGNAQDQFLSLFDGMSSIRRIYAITANSLQDLSDYLQNRPGRFHYHLRFDYPSVDDVREYITDEVPGVSAETIEQVALFSRKVKLNFDHLRALAFELRSGDEFQDVIGDLNIKRTDYTFFGAEIRLADGQVLKTRDHLDLFNETEVLTFYGSSRYLSLEFPTSAVAPDDGRLSIDPLSITVLEGDLDTSQVMSVTLDIQGQESFAF